MTMMKYVVIHCGRGCWYKHANLGSVAIELLSIATEDKLRPSKVKVC